MRKLTSFDDVVAKFGGSAELAQRTRQKPSAVWNWRTKRGRFPAKFYLSMSLELREAGYWAPPHLWGQVKLRTQRDDEQSVAA